MAKLLVFLVALASALVLAVAALLGPGASHSSPPLGAPNFVCVGIHNLGICIGPPTTN